MPSNRPWKGRGKHGSICEAGSERFEKHKKIRKNKDKTNYIMTKQLHELSALKNQDLGQGAQQHLKEG